MLEESYLRAVSECSSDLDTRILNDEIHVHVVFYQTYEIKAHLFTTGTVDKISSGIVSGSNS